MNGSLNIGSAAGLALSSQLRERRAVRPLANCARSREQHYSGAAHGSCHHGIILSDPPAGRCLPPGQYEHTFARAVDECNILRD
jgi:hypothetical protein